VRVWPTGLRVEGRRLRPVVVREGGFIEGGGAVSEDCESSDSVLKERFVLFVPARGRLCSPVTASMPITLMGRWRAPSAVANRRCALARVPLGSSKLCRLFVFGASTCAILKHLRRESGLWSVAYGLWLLSHLSEMPSASMQGSGGPGYGNKQLTTKYWPI